jgi:hypothetical protein
MTIEEAKAYLDDEKMLELRPSPSAHNRPANYHAWKDIQDRYTYDAQYFGHEFRRAPFFASQNFAEFVHHLPNFLRFSTEWMVLE